MAAMATASTEATEDMEVMEDMAVDTAGTTDMRTWHGLMM